MSEIAAVSAQDMMPPAASELWPEAVPVHGLTIVAALRPDGAQALHVLYDSDSPAWVLIGMLDAVRRDFLDAWSEASYRDEDDDD